MLYAALLSFFVALLAGVLGFGGVAAGFAAAGKIVCFLFLVLFFVSFAVTLLRPPGGREPGDGVPL